MSAKPAKLSRGEVLIGGKEREAIKAVSQLTASKESGWLNREDGYIAIRGQSSQVRSQGSV